jgi:putative transcription factor
VLPLQAINEKPSIINEYESGKAIPNGQLISKMERALGFLPLVSPYQRKHVA